MSFAAEPFKAWYVPFTSLSAEAKAEYCAVLKTLFENAAITKIGQNIKFDIMVLNRLGIEVRGRKIDTMLLHYLIDSESRHNMNFLAERYLNYEPIAIESLIGKGAKQLTMDMVNVERVAEYAAEDADVTLRLKEVLYREVEKLAMTDLYHRIEEPMIDVLAAMELEGVHIDTAALDRYAVELREMLQHLENEVRELAGEPDLNINSSRQLGEVLCQATHHRQAEDDQDQAVLDRGGVSANLRPRLPDSKQNLGVPWREEAPFDLCRGSARTGKSCYWSHTHII